MKKGYTNIITIGWAMLLVLMAVAHLMGKSLVPFQPVMIVWLVLTIIHWRRKSNTQPGVTVEMKSNKPSSAKK